MASNPKANHFGVLAHNAVAKKMVSISEVLVASKFDTVESVLKRLRKDVSRFKTIDYVYVADSDEVLAGVVSIRELLGSKESAVLSEIMKTKMISVSPHTDCEKAADLAVKHDIKAVPVVHDKKLVGVLISAQIFSVLNHAMHEDLLRLAGVHKAHLDYENTMAVPLFKSIEHRLPWLLFGLVGITLAAVFISIFEETLQKHLVLAFFLPAVVYMSGALGTQLQTLFIRDLAVMGDELNVKLYFVRQMLIGALLALVISLLVWGIISVFWKETFIGFVIAVSMFITLVISGFTAMGTTLLIKWLHMDPALGSGPFATIVSDVTSIVVYFGVAIIFIGL